MNRTRSGARLVVHPGGRSEESPPAVRTTRTVTRRRLWCLLAALVVLFGLVGARLADLQVLNPDRYVAEGHKQRFTSQVLAADRGSILDRHGRELAMSLPQTTVYTDPRFVDDPAATAALLAPVLGRSEASLRRELAGSGPDDRFGYLARQVDDDVAAEVEALVDSHEIEGIYLTEEPARVTPAGELGRSVIGEVDIDNAGLSGIEEQYASELDGTPGEVVFERAMDGRTIPAGLQSERPPVAGDDVVLTIDRSLQHEVEQILAEQAAESGAESATAVVTDPATGEILAMATVAERDDGSYAPVADNRATSASYEPGSVMKLVTVSGAIEADVVEPDTTFTVPDAITIADKTFTEYEPHGTVSWDVAEILANSSNVGTIKIARELGREGIADSYQRFGFGRTTELGFPGEQGGYLPPTEDWWGTSMGTIPIGHGVSATPLQVLMAYNTIANGGEYVAPSLVRGVVDAAGQRHLLPLAEGRRVVSGRTADEVNLMLRDVVAEGTGEEAQVRGYTPAGKTGTARKVQPGGGYINENGVNDYLSTFVGFVPAEDPAVSIIVVIDDPDAGNGYTGGVVAAPAFSRIAEFALRTGEVPPPTRDPVAARLGLSSAVDERSSDSGAGDSATGGSGAGGSGERVRARAAGSDG